MSALQSRLVVWLSILTAWSLVPPAAAGQGVADVNLGSQSLDRLRSDLDQIEGLMTSIDGGGTYIVDPRMGLDPDPQAGRSVLVLPVSTDDLEKTLLAMLIESESDGEYDDYMEEVQRRTQSVRSELLAWRSRYEAELARRGGAAPDRGEPDDDQYADTRPPCGHTSEFGNTKEISPGVYVECIPDDELPSNPTAGFRPRDHYEPPPVDWVLPSLTLEERCHLTELAVMQNDAEAARAMEESARLEAQLREIDEKLKPIDQRAASDGTTRTLQAAIQAAAYLGQVPEEHRSLATPERVGALEDYVRQASVACSGGYMDALAVGAEVIDRGADQVRDLEWICDHLPPRAALQSMIRRANERDVFHEAQRDLRRQHEEQTRALKELAARAREEGRTANVLSCED